MNLSFYQDIAKPFFSGCHFYLDIVFHENQPP